MNDEKFETLLKYITICVAILGLSYCGAHRPDSVVYPVKCEVRR